MIEHFDDYQANAQVAGAKAHRAVRVAERAAPGLAFAGAARDAAERIRTEVGNRQRTCLCERLFQHRITKVRGDDLAAEAARDGDRKVSCPATRIEAEAGPGRANQFLDFPDCGFPPPMIDRSRQEVIEEIVAMGNTSKHLLDAAAIRTAIIVCFHPAFPSQRCAKLPSEHWA